MSARLALRPAVSRIDPERPGRWSSAAPSTFLRSFAGDAPIQLVGPISGIVVVVAFGVAYVIALASAGAEAVALLGAPTFAAAVLLSGRLAALAWGLTVVATIAVLGPSEAAASEATRSIRRSSPSCRPSPCGRSSCWP